MEMVRKKTRRRATGKKGPIFFLYALLKHPMPRAKANTLQTEPQAGVLGQRDRQDATTAMAGHDSPA